MAAIGAVLDVPLAPTEIYPRLVEARTALGHEPDVCLERVQALLRDWTLPTTVNQPEGALRMEALYLQGQALHQLRRDREALDVLDQVVWAGTEQLEQECLRQLLPRMRRNELVEWSEPARLAVSEGRIGEVSVFEAITGNGHLRRLAQSPTFRVRILREDFGSCWETMAEFRFDGEKVVIDWVQDLPMDAVARLQTARSFFEMREWGRTSQAFAQAAYLVYRFGLEAYALGLTGKALIFDKENKVARASLDALMEKKTPMTLPAQLLPDRVLIAPLDRHRSYPRPTFTENPVSSLLPPNGRETVSRAVKGKGLDPVALCTSTTRLPELLGLRLPGLQAAKVSEQLRQDWPESGIWPVYVAFDDEQEKQLKQRRRKCKADIELLLSMVRGRSIESLTVREAARERKLEAFFSGYKLARAASVGEPSSHLDDYGEPRKRVSVALVAVNEPWEVALHLCYGGPEKVIEQTLWLRRWYRSCGALPVALTDSGVELLIERPPTTVPALMGVVRDHWNYCEALVEEPLEGYADEIAAAGVWFFPWE